MAMKDHISPKTPLQMALERGTEPGGDLQEELDTLESYSVASKADGEAICVALKRLAKTDPPVGGRSALEVIDCLFDVAEEDKSPAFPVLQKKGIPLLINIVDVALDHPLLRDPEDVLLVLKRLAMCGRRAGTDAVLRAVRKPFAHDALLWQVVLDVYADGHRHRARFFRELSDRLPTGFVAVSLLDRANAAYRGGAQGPHPFDCPAGMRQLEQWLTDEDEDHLEYAQSAATALAFLTGQQRDALLAVALEHAAPSVRLEAAWAAARLGREAGVKWLTRACLDVNTAGTAMSLLDDLGRADVIPAESQSDDFQARAGFAMWLFHPCELGRPPDEVTIVDRRELNWPPDGERKPMWLLRYSAKDTTGLLEDDVGIGLFGSITFCFFGFSIEQRPPEDGYAIHCYWEMTHYDLIVEGKVAAESSEYDEMIGHCTLDGLGPVRIKLVADISPRLNYPQRLVALAEAARHSEPGWLVLDGPRSRWYAVSEMPADDSGNTVLMVHVGRVLLGFTEEPDRRRYHRPPTAKRPPEQIIIAYEALLDRVRADPVQARKLLGDSNLLGVALADYTSALASTRGESKVTSTCKVYELLLAEAANVGPPDDEAVFGLFSSLGHSFELYFEALIALNRHADVPALVERLRPHWDHNAGYRILGAAAFRSGHDQIAETFLVQLRDSGENWCRHDEMNFLAEIWCRNARSDEADALLIAAMQGLIELRRSCSDADERANYEQQFQSRRAAYLRLFADRGEDMLKSRGIPVSTLDELKCDD